MTETGNTMLIKCKCGNIFESDGENGCPHCGNSDIGGNTNEIKIKFEDISYENELYDSQKKLFLRQMVCAGIFTLVTVIAAVVCIFVI